MPTLWPRSPEHAGRCALPVLFESVTIDRRSAASLILARGGTQLSPSTAELLAKYTRTLSLDETYDDQPSISGKRAHQSHLLAVLEACGARTLKTLSITFAPGIWPHSRVHPEFQEDIASVLDENELYCEEVTLTSCSWAMVESVLVSMCTSLRSLQWLGGEDNYEHDPVSQGPLRMPLPLLQEVRIDMVHRDFVLEDYLYYLLKMAAPRLTTLSLTASDPTDELPSWDLDAIPFPNLVNFTFGYMPSELYTSIISKSPKLSSLTLCNIEDYEDQPLSSVPTSIKVLKAFNLCLERQPLHSLVPQMKRLTSLKQLPELRYWRRRNGEGPEDLELKSIRADILSIFEARGIPYSEKEHQRLLNYV